MAPTATAEAPRFIDRDAVYHADTCAPLAAAAARGEVELRALARGTYPGTRLTDGTLPGLRSVGLWDASRPQTWGLDWHRNEGIEITCLLHGNVGFATRSGAWRLDPGAVTVTRPWQEHRVGDPRVDASLLAWIILDVGVRRPHQAWVWPEWAALAPQDAARLTELLQYNEHPVWRGAPAVTAAFERLVRLVERVPGRDPGAESQLRIAISEVLLAVLEMLEGERIERDEALASPRRSVALFLEELDERLGEPWTLASMASACGLGRTQFSHYCRELTNMSPIEHLNFRRLSRAAELLRERPSASVTEIAFECGFRSSQYFATAFRRQFGVTPSGWRAGAAA
ncbi:MAG TPA: helix-turn-helix transcriptional regulator [Solirubrobacterales bacterium]